MGESSGRGFTQIYGGEVALVCEEVELTPAECTVLRELVLLTDEQDYCRSPWCNTSLLELQARTRWSTKSIARALDGLLEHGLITQRRTRGHGIKVMVHSFPSLVHMPDDTRKALQAQVSERRFADMIRLAEESQAPQGAYDQDVPSQVPEGACDQGISESAPQVPEGACASALGDLPNALGDLRPHSPVCSEGSLQEDVSTEGVGEVAKLSKEYVAHLESDESLDRTDRRLFAPDGSPWCSFGKGFWCQNDPCLNPNHRAPREATV